VTAFSVLFVVFFSVPPFCDDMRKHITIDIRATTRRGKFLTKEHGKDRQTRAKWHHVTVIKCVGHNRRVTWDNVMSTTDKSL
jgi:hypothetical protein